VWITAHCTRQFIGSRNADGSRLRIGAALERLWQEIRHAARRLLRSPAFTLATVLTLALAIGANASIFAVVYRVVWEPTAIWGIGSVRTLQDILDRAAAQMAFTMVLLAIAAGVSLTLGVVGIYGAMSYLVTRRTGEIGVRLVLGAEPGSVVRMIVRQGGIVALAGIAVGLATAFAGSRLIESLLYGVSPRDPGVLVGTTVVLLCVVLLACWLPARRAAVLNPLDALRSE
jgi:ABC-type antimicrobial peptide transport system permease subunit